MVKKTSLCWALSFDICTTDRNCNTSEISISIFMSVTLTYSRSCLSLLIAASCTREQAMADFKAQWLS
jgi:hypothetical protein